jgi:hypothetical protein
MISEAGEFSPAYFLADFGSASSAEKYFWKS